MPHPKLRRRLKLLSHTFPLLHAILKFLNCVGKEWKQNGTTLAHYGRHHERAGLPYLHLSICMSQVLPTLQGSDGLFWDWSLLCLPAPCHFSPCMLRDPPDSLGIHLAHSSIEFLPVLPMDVLVSVS